MNMVHWKRLPLLSMKFTMALAVVGLLFPCVALARSGCCSHHGGVVGCKCGDGTALSATCAPYYPWCTKPAAPAVMSSSSKACVKNVVCVKGKKAVCVNGKAKCV